MTLYHCVMDKVTVGIVSDNKRFRMAYRLLIEAEADGFVDVLWDALAGKDVQASLNHYGLPDVILVDYEGVCTQPSLNLKKRKLKELQKLFPNSSVLFICNDCEKNSPVKVGKDLRQFLVSKYCSAQKLLQFISNTVLCTILLKRPSRIGLLHK